MRSFYLLLALAAACRTTPEPLVDPDADGDGVAASSDCDDSAADVFPGAPERCDGVDQDCDGVVDNDATDAPTYWADDDADGYGDAAVTSVVCDAPRGYVNQAGDCDDGAAAVHPDAAETDCTDPIDYNCDGAVGFADGDGDGFAACQDCDDAAASVNPSATEQCDGVDNNCDGAVDEAGAIGEATWYADSDGDTFGDPLQRVRACAQPAGYVDNASDCDDAHALALPGGTELCDGLDNDCDGRIDPATAQDASTFYGDNDGDGFGGAGAAVRGCDAPTGFVTTGTDCDDGDSARYPGAPEPDCADPVDYNCDGAVGFADGDGDGFAACQDCDDAAASVNPSAAERCDGVDDNCDGQIDEPGAVGEATWFADADADSYGDPAQRLSACDQPLGYVDNARDCDDVHALALPGGAEVCDDLDNDCDGKIDPPTAADAQTFYGDADNDGYGATGTAVRACVAPTGFITKAGDCDDAQPLAYPTGVEVCDDIDNNCVGGVDEGFDKTWWLDFDRDSSGGSTYSATACVAPSGYVRSSDDCDDSNPLLSPLLAEVWYDGVDTDCSGGSDLDQDGDGHDDARYGGDDCYDLEAQSYVCTLGTGVDGELVGSQLGEVINRYTAITVPVAAGDRDLNVSDATGWATGDEVLILQVQGLGAGNYAFGRVASVATGLITLNADIALDFGADSLDHTQVVRVPQYTSVNIPSGTSLSASPWDGAVGGVVAFRSLGGVQVDGAIDVSGLGFRGVARQNINNQPGDQGEGIDGAPALTRNPNGNGGGGGERNGCECCWGGAGGGGGHALFGWDGSNGGNACQLGGLGGDPVGDANQSQWFFGGGGGQGGADEDGYGSGGGNGGGFAFIGAQDLVVTGTLAAGGINGPGEVNFGGCGSGGGGGGAGGGIYLEVGTADLGTNRVLAPGGAGGDTPNNCGTAGGGGSEGRITVAYTSTVVGSSAPAAQLIQR